MRISSVPQRQVKPQRQAAFVIVGCTFGEGHFGVRAERSPEVMASVSRSPAKVW